MIFSYLYGHTQTTKAMEYLIIIAIVIFVLAVLSGLKSKPNERLTEEEKVPRKEEWRMKQEGENAPKFPKIEYSLQDTCIYCDVVGMSYRNSYAIERARKLQNFEPLVLIWEAFQ